MVEFARQDEQLVVMQCVPKGKDILLGVSSYKSHIGFKTLEYKLYPVPRFLH